MIARNEQYESKESFYHLELCCRLVSEKFGNAAINSWTNSDYQLLSGKLARATNIHISASTLKRIFGKLKTPERYYPQRATRDALANFAGFTSWEQFVSHHAIPRPQSTELSSPAFAIVKNSDQQENSLEVSSKKKSRRWLAIASSVLLVTVFAVLYLGKTDQPIDLNDISLKCQNPVGDNPHSATFQIQLPKNFNGDAAAFTMNFDDGKFEKNVPASKLFTRYYEIPGRYYPVLKYKGINVDTLSVYTQSKGWTATATMERDTIRVYPVNSSTALTANNLNVSARDLYAAGIDTSHTFYVHFVNAQPFEIDGDNFELSARILTSGARPGVRCSQLEMQVFGEQTKHSVMLIKPGCVSWAYLKFAEVQMDGDTDDLSSIGVDLSKGGVVKFRVENKKVVLSVDGKELYKTSYQSALRKIYGVEISFSGIGAASEVVLTDLRSGKTVGL